MSNGLPLAHLYNLARLGQAVDTVRFSATAEECTAIAGWSGVVAVNNLSVQVDIKKLTPSRFALVFAMTADVVQSCVVTLAPVPAHIQRHFTRELHFPGPIRRGSKLAESATITIADAEEEEPPEEIGSLQYDLAGPILEEYVLALEPYPRVKGAKFGLPQAPEDAPESPFAVLKNLKSGA